MLTERSVDVLHGQLEDLDIPGTSRFACSELLDESTLDITAASNTVFLLCQRLLKYGPTSDTDSSSSSSGMDVEVSPLNSNCTTLDEIIANVVSLYPRFNTKSAYPMYRALFHLCSQLQAKRLVRAQSGSAQRIESVEATSKVMFQVVKICTNLSIDSSALVNSNNNNNSKASADAGNFKSVGGNSSDVSLMSKLFGEMRVKIESLQQRVSPTDRQPLLPLETGIHSLTAAQKSILGDLQKSSYEDYHRRRQMMLKRVDVTIQGFLWGANIAGKEGEIVTAIQAQRRELSEFPCQYSIQDIFSAPHCLLYEFTRSVSTSVSMHQNKSLVKTLIIGAVPDRGGRVAESTLRSANISSWGGSSGAGNGNGGGYKKHNNNHSNNNNNSKSANSRGNNKEGGGSSSNKNSSVSGAKGDSVRSTSAPSSHNSNNTNTNSNINNSTNGNSNGNSNSNGDKNDKSAGGSTARSNSSQGGGNAKKKQKHNDKGGGRDSGTDRVVKFV